jgi:hypothetical protein
LGLSAEGGLTAELRVLRFLSVQIEADVLYEAFDAPRMTATGNIRTRSTDTFSSVSLLFPVLAKAPLPLGSGRFTLSLYGGAYYLLSPWGAERTASGKTERVAGRTDPPFGIVAGADLGFRAGPGELVADLRYGNHLGTTELGDDGIDSQHIGNRINLSVGYRLGVK